MRTPSAIITKIDEEHIIHAYTNRITSIDKLRRNYKTSHKRIIQILQKNNIKLRSNHGPDHMNYKGKSPLMKEIRNSEKYKQWRLTVYIRDNYTCQNCQLVGGNLEAHHRIPKAIIIELYQIKNIEQALKCELLWKVKNGITLCRKCHMKEHKLTLKRLIEVSLEEYMNTHLLDKS